MNTSPEHILEDIINARRSIRAMTDEFPDPELIKMVLNAGYAAPHAASLQGNTQDFRQFFVIAKTASIMPQIKIIAKRTLVHFVDSMEKDAGDNTLAHPFIQKLKTFAESEIPGIGSAPYLVIIGEKVGFPPVQQQSIAHCLENMWLMATALGLGFHLVSVISQVGEDPEFCRLIQIQPGEYRFNGCAIGIPASIPPAKEVGSAESVTTWIQ
jgi:nitroreductase